MVLTSETATILGRKGGLVKSARKSAAVRINALKDGRRAKHPSNVKILEPTALEKEMGLDRQKKIQLIKELAPALGAENVQEFFEHHAHTLLQFKAKIGIAEEKSGKEQIYWFGKYTIMEREFGVLRWQMNRFQFTQNQLNIGVPPQANGYDETLRKMFQDIQDNPDIIDIELKEHREDEKHGTL